MADDDILGVNGVILWTDDLQTMTAFYRDLLGLTPRSTRERLTNFAWGDFRLTLSVHDNVHGKSRDPERVMVNLAVADIRAVHRRLSALGVVFTRPPERESFGGWVATFHDPDGNTLQLLQPHA
jgi:catechol 2,3-dioxygenase-like lactoylglutathione lyase family enzyme